MLKSLMMEILGVGASPAQSSDATLSTHGLRDLKWQKRVVLIVADDGNIDANQQEQALMVSPPALGERDIALFRVDEHQGTPLFGSDIRLETARLAQDLGIVPGRFSLILIGKDGRIKMRSDHVIGPAVLFATIDAMPMRQAESRA